MYVADSAYQQFCNGGLRPCFIRRMGAKSRRKTAEKRARMAAAIEKKGKIHPTKKPKVDVRDSSGRFGSASRFPSEEPVVSASCAICGVGIDKRLSRRKNISRFITFSASEPKGTTLSSNTYGCHSCHKYLRSLGSKLYTTVASMVNNHTLHIRSLGGHREAQVLVHSHPLSLANPQGSNTATCRIRSGGGYRVRR